MKTDKRHISTLSSALTNPSADEFHNAADIVETRAAAISKESPRPFHTSLVHLLHANRVNRSMKRKKRGDVEGGLGRLRKVEGGSNRIENCINFKKGSLCTDYKLYIPTFRSVLISFLTDEHLPSRRKKWHISNARLRSLLGPGSC